MSTNPHLRDSGIPDELLRQLGILTDAAAPVPVRIRSSIRWFIPFLVVGLGTPLMLGPVLGGVWMLGLGVNAADFGEMAGFLCGGVALIALGAFLLYQASKGSVWVELDGDVLRARAMFTFRVTEHLIEEIEEVRTLVRVVRHAPEVIVTDALLGHVAGFEIRFRGARRSFGLLSHDMNHVPELIGALLAHMAERGRLLPEMIQLQGRPILKRITWEDAPGD